MTDVSHGVAG